MFGGHVTLAVTDGHGLMESYEEKLRRTIAEAKAKSEAIKSSKRCVIVLGEKDVKRLKIK